MSWSAQSRAAVAERMRKRNADPAFAQAFAERMRKLHADPSFTKAKAERISEALRKAHAGKLHAIGVLPGSEDTFRLARRKGFSKMEAVRIANDSSRGAAP